MRSPRRSSGPSSARGRRRLARGRRSASPWTNQLVPPPKRIVITGASSGLGRELALGYAAPDVRLGLVGREPARLAASAQACRARGAVVDEVALDVGEAAPLGAWLAAFEAAGPIDLVVANAGTSASVQSDAAADGVAMAVAQVRTNLLGAIHTLEPVIPGMIARRSGQIALVASTAAYRGVPYMPGYCASKAGARGYGEALRALLAPHGVMVSVVLPSFFESAMSARYQGPKPMMLSTAAAATRVRLGLDRAEPRIVFPRRMGLLMQLFDLLPARVGDAILRGERFRIDNP